MYIVMSNEISGTKKQKERAVKIMAERLLKQPPPERSVAEKRLNWCEREFL